AMSADAQLDPRGLDGAEVRAGEVSLAEMHEFGAEIDGLAPIVIDHELAAKRFGGRERTLDLGRDRVRGRVLDAKLNEPCALVGDAGNPGGIGQDGVERIEPARAQETRSILKNGVPATGVDGEAMSRGGVSPASKPSRPASMARANACAIFTGLPALATAVL